MPARKSIANTAAKARKETTVSAIDIVAIAEVLEAKSGFISDELFSAEMLNEIVRNRFPSIDQEKIAGLIDATGDAVTQLIWDRQQPNKKAFADKYSAVIESAACFAENLSIVLGDSSLEGPFLDLLVPRTSSPEQVERRDRFRHQMLGDLFWLRFMVEPKIQMIRSAQRIRKVFEYRCAFRIAFAWLTATGEIPTLTRNTDWVFRPPRSPPFKAI
jgi:hypothetical protein